MVNVAPVLTQSTYWRMPVAKFNLSGMDVHALIDLRKQIEDTLVSQRSTLERQLAALGGSMAPKAGVEAR
jgi:hypothetical protein